MANGQTAGAWLQLDWTSSQSVSRVVIWDRPNQEDNILAGTLTFSDGSPISFGAPANGASSALAVSIVPARDVTSVRLTVTQTDSYSSNIGLAELQVFGVSSNIPAPPTARVIASTSFPLASSFVHELCHFLCRRAPLGSVPVHPRPSGSAFR